MVSCGDHKTCIFMCIRIVTGHCPVVSHDARKATDMLRVVAIHLARYFTVSDLLGIHQFDEIFY